MNGPCLAGSPRLLLGKAPPLQETRNTRCRQSLHGAGSDVATDAEKIGLTVHLARCYYMIGQKDDARQIYGWAYSLARRTYGPSSALTKKTLRILKHINRLG